MGPVPRERWLAHADRALREAGLRASAGRTAVVELLAREGDCLLSAQQLADRLRAREMAGSTATVYRTLEILHGLGLVSRFDGGDGVARFEIAHPTGHHHHHLLDEVSGTVTPFEDPALERAIEAIAVRLGVSLTGHDVILRTRDPASEDATSTR